MKRHEFLIWREPLAVSCRAITEHFVTFARIVSRRGRASFGVRKDLTARARFLQVSRCDNGASDVKKRVQFSRVVIWIKFLALESGTRLKTVEALNE